ncbi:MAG: putative inorganic carbon (HCO3(-)) transporter [Paraglaciecola sp.]|jgi:putative inorganic carbon (HCO3(-)) transporter
MTDIFLILVILMFIFFGLTRPIIACGGYIWTDVVMPHKITFGFMADKPISMILAILVLVSLVINVKKLKKPSRTAIMWLLIVFFLWITLTTTQAYFQKEAWFKWDVAFKTILMSVLMMFAVRSKKDLEFLLIVFVSSVGFYMISAGLKTLAGGGGYGANLIVGSGNVGIAESSTLAFYSVLCIPLLLFLKNNITLIPFLAGRRLIWYGAILLAIGTVIGTQSRTGLVALGVLLIIEFVRSKKKLPIVFGSIFIAIIGLTLASQAWKDRMNTMNDVQNEASAMGRIVVWRWTWDFVKSNPLGGGFGAYRANYGQLNQYLDNPDMGFSKAKAFHSVYFEVLGEHGYPGILMYLLLAFLMWRSNIRIIKSNSSDDNWYAAVGIVLNRCLFVFLVGGAFVGVAFQPLFYQLLVFTVSLAKLSDSKKAVNIEKTPTKQEWSSEK